jgi:hypothetical protein
MAKQDEWKRITLRIPPDLHSRLVAASETGSLNSVIIEALEEKFPAPPPSIAFNEIYELMAFIEAGKDEAEMSARAAEVNKRLLARGAGMSIQISVDPSTGEINTHMTIT